MDKCRRFFSNPKRDPETNKYLPRTSIRFKKLLEECKHLLSEEEYRILFGSSSHKEREEREREEREDYDYFDLLPIELLFETFLHLEPKEILRLCRTNNKINVLCKDEAFWKAKKHYDFEHGRLPEFLEPYLDNLSVNDYVKFYYDVRERLREKQELSKIFLSLGEKYNISQLFVDGVKEWYKENTPEKMKVQERYFRYYTNPLEIRTLINLVVKLYEIAGIEGIKELIAFIKSKGVNPFVIRKFMGEELTSLSIGLRNVVKIATSKGNTEDLLYLATLIPSSHLFFYDVQETLRENGQALTPEEKEALIITLLESEVFQNMEPEDKSIILEDVHGSYSNY